MTFPVVPSAGTLVLVLVVSDMVGLYEHPAVVTAQKLPPAGATHRLNGRLLVFVIVMQFDPGNVCVAVVPGDPLAVMSAARLLARVTDVSPRLVVALVLIGSPVLL